ncbi:MAG: DNA polymerase III subunit delta', partial [Clostridiales bacterium]|nr:DNA polymerase III subunit delta' [Clostridiales bacterium]
MRGDIASGRSAHAYLFAGPAGTGKRSLADLCARAWNCLGRDAPCGVCAHCARSLGGNDPDLMVIEPEKSIGVDDVRALTEWLSTRPGDAGRRVAIVRGADRMTVPAQNALLKTLESPPGDAVIVLIAESAAALLPTVVSRCRIMRFSPLDAGDAARALIARGIAPDRAALLSRLAMGSVGRALQIDQSED